MTVKFHNDLIKEIKFEIQKEINRFDNEFVKRKYHISAWLIRTILLSYYHCRWRYNLDEKNNKK